MSSTKPTKNFVVRSFSCGLSLGYKVKPDHGSPPEATFQGQGRGLEIDVQDARRVGVENRLPVDTRRNG